ncbi:hypothetical protein [Sodalis sp.]|uniref:hypothetical protein n=1 Tax=Sodalis sp. (in: enterobacteria) TaxID=1898979 RepID=UPI003873B334
MGNHRLISGRGFRDAARMMATGRIQGYHIVWLILKAQAIQAVIAIADGGGMALDKGRQKCSKPVRGQPALQRVVHSDILIVGN